MSASVNAVTLARELAARLGLHRAGREWRGMCPACGYAESFVLADGKRGPIGWCATCGDRAAIAQALGSPRSTAPHMSQQTNANDAARRLERAERLLRGSEPASQNAIAYRYLDSRRIGHLAACADLRFRLDCPHPTSTRERPVRLPALIAAVRDVDGKLVGIHRTFLKRDGSGKADIEPPRASLGPVRGGAVRLAPLENVLAVGEVLVGEGIETSASAGLLLGLPPWAAMSAGNLGSGVALPAAIQRVMIAVDRDSPGLQAARAALARLRREGRAVRVATPDKGVGDFSDILSNKRPE